MYFTLIFSTKMYIFFIFLAENVSVTSIFFNTTAWKVDKT